MRISTIVVGGAIAGTVMGFIGGCDKPAPEPVTCPPGDVKVGEQCCSKEGVEGFFKCPDFSNPESTGGGNADDEPAPPPPEPTADGIDA